MITLKEEEEPKPNGCLSSMFALGCATLMLLLLGGIVFVLFALGFYLLGWVV